MEIQFGNMVGLCNQFLKMHDPRLMEHGAKVAYLASRLVRYHKQAGQLDVKQLTLLALFHDIGAYKTEEIDRLVQFETEDVNRHAAYGYLFLYHFTALAPVAQAVLYHHTRHSQLLEVEPTIRLYAELIRLADRVDIGMQSGLTPELLLDGVEELDIDPLCIDALRLAMEAGELQGDTLPGRVLAWEADSAHRLPISQEEAVQYLEMMVYTLDFKSEATALHSTNTVVISTFLAKALNLSAAEVEDIYYAALVHDLGKAGIPTQILEFPGKLDARQMEIMKGHVSFTYDIIKDLLPPQVVSIAVRHHEKLDGSGYPYGLTAAELTLSDRIVAVADIVSALGSRRSYKKIYDEEAILAILQDMVDHGLLDGTVVDLVRANRVPLQQVVRVEGKPILEKFREVQRQYRTLLAGLQEREPD